MTSSYSNRLLRAMFSTSAPADWPESKAHTPLPCLYWWEASSSTGFPHICGRSQTQSLSPQPGSGVRQLCSIAIIFVVQLKPGSLADLGQCLS